MDDNIVPQPMEWGSQQPSFRAMFKAGDKVERLRNDLTDCENDFHALKEMFDKLLVDRDLWKEVAENLAAELGKKEYAYAEYENCKEVAEGIAW